MLVENKNAILLNYWIETLKLTPLEGEYEKYQNSIVKRIEISRYIDYGHSVLPAPNIFIYMFYINDGEKETVLKFKKIHTKEE